MDYPIHIEKLTKYYGKNLAVDHISLKVHTGEIFGFIGPNGAGKSTTIRTLLGLIHPTKGNAYLLGQKVKSNNVDILQQVGYLPSESNFYGNMRVRDIIQFSADMRRMDCAAESKKLCERFQLDTGKRVDELSLGNRKKLSIVCAMQHDPKLLIFDEPTSGLDPFMQREFFSLLEEKKDAGATVFLSTHILSEIQNHCSRAAVIQKGKILACEDIPTLFKSNMQKVSFQGKADVSSLKGVTQLEENGNSVHFLYQGESSALVQCLAKGNIAHLSISEPDLEDMFLQYYGEEGNSNGIDKA